jgi:gas vesicle protein
MVFDITSFLAGVAAGAATGALAATLHRLENTADLQERLRQITREVERMRSVAARGTDASEAASLSEMDALTRDLNEIHDEIKHMYKKGKR